MGGGGPSNSSRRSSGGRRRGVPHDCMQKLRGRGVRHMPELRLLRPRILLWVGFPSLGRLAQQQQ
eukprot:4276508-Pyramimonas_sp.AAC.1